MPVHFRQPKKAAGYDGRDMMAKMRATRLAVFLCLGIFAVAQSLAVFKTRLSPVAMDATMRATVAGSGTVSARLTGSRLVVDGSFEGLLSPATIAQVRQSAMTGVRGPSVFDLTVTKATSGTIGGAIDLTSAQTESLRRGRLYVQIHSEKAPDGNLWGWLLP
jgi:CHRD domain